MKTWFGLIISAIIFILTTYIRFQLGWFVDFYVTTILYFLFTLVSIKKLHKKEAKQFCFYEIISIVFLFFLGSSIDYVVIGEFNWVPVYYPNPIHYCLAIILAYKYHVIKARKFQIPIILLFLLLIHNLYYPYLERYSNMGIFNSNVEEQLNSKVCVYDENNIIHEIKSNKHKYLILDFWFVGCTPCYKSFPKIESIYKKHKDRIDIMCINYPINNSTNDNFNPFEHLRIRGFTFPVFAGDSSLATTFNIKSFPTVLLIKDNMIVFRGNIEDLIEAYDL